MDIFSTEMGRTSQWHGRAAHGASLHWALAGRRVRPWPRKQVRIPAAGPKKIFGGAGGRMASVGLAGAAWGLPVTAQLQRAPPWKGPPLAPVPREARLYSGSGLTLLTEAGSRKKKGHDFFWRQGRHHQTKPTCVFFPSSLSSSSC